MENNNDFKYILQDMSHVFVGKELTYDEIVKNEDVPFKFKAIIQSYFLKDTSLDVKMSDHVLIMENTSFSYQIYSQLKLQIRYFYKEQKKGFGGKTKENWVHKTCSLKDLNPQIVEAINNNEMIVEDISISKLALMTISI